MSIQMEQSRETIEQQKWLIKRAKIRRMIKEGVMWVVVLTTFAFLLMFMMGLLVAYAAPDGWAAVRVAVLAGGLSAMVIFVLSSVFVVIWLADEWS